MHGKVLLGDVVAEADPGLGFGRREAGLPGERQVAPVDPVVSGMGQPEGRIAHRAGHQGGRRTAATATVRPTGAAGSGWVWGSARSRLHRPRWRWAAGVRRSAAAGDDHAQRDDDDHDEREHADDQPPAPRPATAGAAGVGRRRLPRVVRGLDRPAGAVPVAVPTTRAARIGVPPGQAASHTSAPFATVVDLGIDLGPARRRCGTVGA